MSARRGLGVLLALAIGCGSPPAAPDAQPVDAGPGDADALGDIDASWLPPDFPCTPGMDWVLDDDQGGNRGPTEIAWTGSEIALARLDQGDGLHGAKLRFERRGPDGAPIAATHYDDAPLHPSPARTAGLIYDTAADALSFVYAAPDAYRIAGLDHAGVRTYDLQTPIQWNDYDTLDDRRAIARGIPGHTLVAGVASGYVSIASASTSGVLEGTATTTSLSLSGFACGATCDRFLTFAYLYDSTQLWWLDPATTTVTHDPMLDIGTSEAGTFRVLGTWGDTHWLLLNWGFGEGSGYTRRSVWTRNADLSYTMVQLDLTEAGVATIQPSMVWIGTGWLIVFAEYPFERMEDFSRVPRSAWDVQLDFVSADLSHSSAWQMTGHGMHPRIEVVGDAVAVTYTDTTDPTAEHSHLRVLHCR